MRFTQRFSVLIIIILLFLIAYGVSRYYSPTVVAYVVEQTLLQKAPEGADAVAIRERLHAVLSSASPEDKLQKLLALSNYLEKVQRLTVTELDRLLETAGKVAGSGD